MRKKILSLALTLALCLGLAIPAFAVPERKTVHAGNEEELLAALKSNTTIVLEDKTYVSGLYLEKLENVTIQGTGSTRIVVDNGSDVVISLGQCKNVTLNGLVLGHDIEPEGDCTSGVVSGWDTSLTIVNCDIFGCGLTGLSISGSLEMRDSTIRDCAEQIISLDDGHFTFQNCTFSGNGYALDTPNDWSAVYVGAYGEKTTLSFTDCTFVNNKFGLFLETFEREGGTVSHTLNRCTFQGNSWPEPGSGQAAPLQAVPTNDSLTCNGTAQNPTVYKIDGSNYFKIRDLAAILNGTEKQFSVGYDSALKSVTATTGQGYDKLDGDLAGAATGGSQSAAASNDAIYVNGEKIAAEVYKIGGSNYFKLRDLGEALDFYVGWSKERGMYIETDKPYSK